MKKRAVWLLLALLLVTALVGLCACGDDSETQEQTEEETEAPSSDLSSDTPTEKPSASKPSGESSEEPTVESTEAPSEGASAGGSNGATGEEPTEEATEKMEVPVIPVDQAYVRIDDYLWFGEYPQTLKKDSVTITATTDARGYFLGSDGAYYAKVVASPDEKGYTFANGKEVTEGETYYFKVEPIRWRIASQTGTKALIVCDSIIEVRPYDDDVNNYKNSEIRAWLNDGFMKAAFSELQKTLIQTTTVSNNAQSTGDSKNPYADKSSTKDQIFLIANNELASKNGLSKTNERKMLTSDYARANGAYMSRAAADFGNGYWWLRSPGSAAENFAQCVPGDGDKGYYDTVSRTNIGVVPAMNITLPVLEKPTDEQPSEQETEAPEGEGDVIPDTPVIADDEAYVRIDDYIWFGEYPQSLKAENVTVTDTADARGYFLGSDGAYYAKVVATPYANNYKFANETAVTEGTAYYFKVEPIRWTVLEEMNGEALILCDSIMTNHRYDDDANHYELGEIRAWLNETFYEVAFNDLQKKIVAVTTVDNSASSTGNASNDYACEDTEDKVFLPSFGEITDDRYGFATECGTADHQRKMMTSDYARANGAFVNQAKTDVGNGSWWLRSPYAANSSNAHVALYTGTVSEGGANVASSSYGIVPALRITLK